ncbi:MAG: Maf family protein [Rhodospirillales bacterium]|jgi:septum formation protein|nr:Maf family protein [Rhodospirillales bacterium]
MNPAPSLILASASTVRARILTAAGISVSIEPAHLDEDAIKEEAKAAKLSAADGALRLATAKAMTISGRRPRALIIGADQMLECAGRWFDKPRDRADARENLLFLRSREQHLVSAVAAVRDGVAIWQTIDIARLWMRPFSESFLDRYLEIAGDEVCQSVGGCKLEGLGIQFFERIEGDFFTILGLPILPLLAFLRDYGALGE